MDRVDQQIVSLLRAEARTPISQIARQVNLSRPPVSERTHQLENPGGISGYHAQVQWPGRAPVQAYLELFYKDSRCQEYVGRLRGFAEVRRISSISGETDMLLYVEAEHMARLGELREEIGTWPGIQRVKTHVIVQEWPV